MTQIIKNDRMKIVHCFWISIGYQWISMAKYVFKNINPEKK